MTSTANIIPINIEDEIRHSYMDYAMSVIIGRALPDVRDGLKPVHRRILYAQHDLGNRYNAAYKKSARIVGDVIGKYHPHGDSSVYDALVRMAQDFNMRLPLVDGQGNFGSVDGDPAAAMRYTEVRMARATQELLGDIEKDTVDWQPNYDGTLQEPVVMPTRIPNLLVNGSSGIAVGMSTNIPPHNLREVVDAVIALIDDAELEHEELLRLVPGPDFPTGGIIQGREGIRDAYLTGRGIVRIRAKAEIEHDERNGKSRIIVTELPYQVNKAKLLMKIAELVREKRIEGITDLRDESDRQGMRMVVELRRDVVPEVILNNLFKMTALQSSFGIIMLAIVNGQPQIMALREVLSHFIDFRRDVVTRRTQFELAQAEARAHILRGLKIALDNLDAVIKLIRASASGAEAREGLMSTFSLSELQAQAILDMRLQKLTGLERDKIIAELEEILAEIERLKAILADEVKLMALIKQELEVVRDSYSDPRRTLINASASELSDEDLIADEQMVVTITHTGYIKRTPLAEYREQQRGGKGKRGMQTRDEDFVEDLFVASSHAHILFFTTIGKVYKLKIHELPLRARTNRGLPIVNLIPIVDGERVKAVLPVAQFEEGKFVMTASRRGVVKKTDLMAFSRVLSVGIIALSLREGDELVDARVTGGQDFILLASTHGKAIVFDEDDVRPMGRTAAGVQGMRFEGDDELVSMCVIPHEVAARLQRGGGGAEDDEAVVTEPGAEPAGQVAAPVTSDAGDDAQGLERVLDKVLVVTAHGYGKRTLIDEYRVQGRGGKGVITIKTSERNGAVIGVRLVASGDGLMLITSQGQIIRIGADSVSLIGRNTQGVRLMTLGKAETLVGVARLSEVEDDEGEDEEAVEAQASLLEAAPAAASDEGEGGEAAPEGQDEPGSEDEA